MQRKAGFTLVEIMVVLAVTAMLSSLILVYNASTRETLRLFTEKARVAQLVLRAKSLAISTYTETGVTPCGYGLRFNRVTGSYALVAYRPASCRDRSRVDTSDDAYEVVQATTFELPSTIEFEDRGDAKDVSYIIFIPPDPAVLIARDDGSLVEDGLGRVAMRIKGRETDAIVTINAAGQVTF